MMIIISAFFYTKMYLYLPNHIHAQHVHLALNNNLVQGDNQIKSECTDISSAHSPYITIFYYFCVLSRIVNILFSI